MAESAPIDPGTLSNLCKTFKVSKGTCEYFNKCYNERILPCIQRNYLAHLVAAIEEIIDEKIKEDNRKKNPEDASDKKARDFFIVLRPDPPPQKPAEAICLRKGVFINYKPNYNFKELRVFIAHELGHVLRHYEIILNDDNENHANLFAYFAINGKNNFYQNKVRNLIYSSEEEIISTIQILCPIQEERQKDKEFKQGERY